MTKLEILCALSLLAGPAAAARLPRPEPAALLDAALAEPATAYTARVRVQFFDERGKSQAQTREVVWAGPGRERVDSYAKRKTPSMTRVRDGGEETVVMPALKRAWRGPRAEPDPGVARRHRDRLHALYDLSVSTGGQVAKRPTWRLELRSKADGKVRRVLWVDRATSFPLKREDYRLDGTLRLRERTLRWQPGAAEIRPVEVPPGVEVLGHGEAFLGCTPSKECAAPGVAFLRPTWLPEGCVLFRMSVGPGTSLSTSYTDGLSMFSYITLPPGTIAASYRPYVTVSLKDGKAELYTEQGSISLGVRGRDLVMQAGILAEDEQARVVDSLEPAR